jgi:hypothetical protein
MIKIFSEKVEFVADKPKIDARIPGHKPGGGDKVIIIFLKIRLKSTYKPPPPPPIVPFLKGESSIVRVNDLS